MGWVNAGQRVKVALVWDSNSTFDYSTDPLNADLDLWVFGPNQVQASASWDNSYETVDFTATVSGNFQIKVKKFRFDGFNEYFGVPRGVLIDSLFKHAEGCGYFSHAFGVSLLVNP